MTFLKVRRHLEVGEYFFLMIVGLSSAERHRKKYHEKTNIFYPYYQPLNKALTVMQNIWR